jgi:hypothetical protein
MSCTVMCLAVAVVGFDVGWQPRPQGGVEYLLQLSLPAIEALRGGEMIQSDIPPEVMDVRAIRLMVGSAHLPRQLPAVAAASAADPLLPPPTVPTIDPKIADVSPIGPGQGAARAAPLAAPQTLPVGVAGRPLPEHSAAFVQTAGEAAKSSPPVSSQATSPQQGPASPEPEQRPWLLLTCVSLGFFASLGTNLFLGWIAWDAQRRYRAIIGGANTPAQETAVEQVGS